MIILIMKKVTFKNRGQRKKKKEKRDNLNDNENS